MNDDILCLIILLVLCVSAKSSKLGGRVTQTFIGGKLDIPIRKFGGPTSSTDFKECLSNTQICRLAQPQLWKSPALLKLMTTLLCSWEDPQAWLSNFIEVKASRPPR